MEYVLTDVFQTFLPILVLWGFYGVTGSLQMSVARKRQLIAKESSAG